MEGESAQFSQSISIAHGNPTKQGVSVETYDAIFIYRQVILVHRLVHVQYLQYEYDNVRPLLSLNRKLSLQITCTVPIVKLEPRL